VKERVSSTGSTLSAASSGRVTVARISSGGRLPATLSARVLYEQGDIDAADRLIRDRLVLSGSQGGIEGALSSYIVAARIAAAR